MFECVLRLSLSRSSTISSLLSSAFLEVIFEQTDTLSHLVLYNQFFVLMLLELVNLIQDDLADPLNYFFAV